MNFSESDNPITELPNQIKASLNAKIDLFSLFLIKKLSKIVPLFVLGLILGFIFLFFTLFLSHSFIAWYEDYVGKGSTAALIVSGFYLLLGIIIFVFRKKIIYAPIHTAIIEGLNFKEVHTASQIGEIHTVKDLDEELEKSKVNSEILDEELNDSINDAKDYYTFDSIKSRFFTNIIENPKPLIGTILQSVMSIQNFKSRRRSKRQE